MFSARKSTGWLPETAQNKANHTGGPKLVPITHLLTIHSPVSPPTKVQELHRYPRTSQTSLTCHWDLCCHQRDRVFKHMESPELLIHSKGYMGYE